MGAVHIGIRHDDDLVIPQLGVVKFVADARAQRRDHRLELVVAVHLVRTGLFHVQHLAPQGKDGLKTGIPALRGGAACGVALHDVQLGEFRVVFVAVPQLIRHGRAAQRRLAADGLSCLLGGLPRPVGGEGLVQNHAAHLRILLQEGIQLVGNDVVHQRPDLAVAQLGLGLAFKLCVRQLHGNNAGQTLPAVLAGDLLIVLEHFDLPAVVIQHRGQRTAEALLMHTALRGVDVVGKGQGSFIIAVVILHGDLRHGIALLPCHIDDLLVEGGLGAVEVGDKLPDTALVAHGVVALLLRLSGRGIPLIGNGDPQTGVQESLLPHPGVEGIIAVNGVLKHFGVRLERDSGAGVIRGTHHGHGFRDLAPCKLHLMDLAVPVNLHHQPFAQGVHHGSAHAVEAAGYLVAPAAELAAGVQHGVHHFQSGLAGLGLNVHGDAAAVIHHGDGVALVDGDGDLRAVARQRFVDGVVHDLIHQMVKAGGRSGADIHTGTLSDGFQPFQNLNFRCVILVGGVHRRGLQNFVVCHVGSPFVSGQEEPSRTASGPFLLAPIISSFCFSVSRLFSLPDFHYSTSLSLSARFFRVEVFSWLRYTICGWYGWSHTTKDLGRSPDTSSTTPSCSALARYSRVRFS